MGTQTFAELIKPPPTRKAEGSTYTHRKKLKSLGFYRNKLAGIWVWEGHTDELAFQMAEKLSGITLKRVNLMPFSDLKKVMAHRDAIRKLQWESTALKIAEKFIEKQSCWCDKTDILCARCECIRAINKCKHTGVRE